MLLIRADYAFNEILQDSLLSAVLLTLRRGSQEMVKGAQHIRCYLI